MKLESLKNRYSHTALTHILIDTPCTVSEKLHVKLLEGMWCEISHYSDRLIDVVLPDCILISVDQVTNNDDELVIERYLTYETPEPVVFEFEYLRSSGITTRRILIDGEEPKEYRGYELHPAFKLSFAEYNMCMISSIYNLDGFLRKLYDFVYEGCEWVPLREEHSQVYRITLPEQTKHVSSMLIEYDPDDYGIVMFEIVTTFIQTKKTGYQREWVYTATLNVDPSLVEARTFHGELEYHPYPVVSFDDLFPNITAEDAF